jgi:hypothetical protein
VTVDAVVGVVAVAVDAAARGAARVRPVAGPLVSVVLDPPLLPARLHPRRAWDGAVRRGAALRTSATGRALKELDVLVPALTEQLLRRLDLEAVVTAHLDLDGLVSSVDLDAAAGRLDVDAVAARLDVGAVVDRVDLDAAAARLDIDAVARRLDIDAVARRLDLDVVLDRLDLTDIVLDRVDLDAVVRAVLDRVDLAAIAMEVIDAVDLPEIIRESTGSLASDTVRGARMQSIAADEAVARVRNRLLLRRGTGSGERVPPQRDRGT